MSALGVLRRGSAFVALGSALLACAVADGESPAAPLVAGLSVEGSTTTLSASATTAAEEDRPVETDRAVEVVGVESTPPDPRPNETSLTSVSVSESSPPTSDRVSASTSIPTPDRVSAPTSIPTPENDAGLLGALTVVAEGPRTGYDRSLFSHWRDTNGSGCDARQDTLAEQVIGFPQVDLFDSCVIVEGDWYSIFDGVTHSGSPSELDIDHVIALAEAWDSGASTWDSATRRRFANDPAHLVAVTASSNRSKSDADLADWRPIRSAWCVTATITAEVKAAYGLSVDPAEYDAIAEMLGTCGASDQVTIGVAPVGTVPVVTAAPTTSASPTTTQPTSVAPEDGSVDDGSVGDCVDINTASAEALDAIVHVGPSRAADIIALRPFSSVEDLTRVSGIGASRLADILAEGLACVR
ncbi:MAG: helix-hairpin-helix domain-containing protein [Ilumatobacteraceae bacterium]